MQSISLQFAEIKGQLTSIESAIKDLSKERRTGLADTDDIDSLLSSLQSTPAFGSSFQSPTPAFGSPTSLQFASPPTGFTDFRPCIPSQSGKVMRGSSAPPSINYFASPAYNPTLTFPSVTKPELQPTSMCGTLPSQPQLQSGVGLPTQSFEMTTKEVAEPFLGTVRRAQAPMGVGEPAHASGLLSQDYEGDFSGDFAGRCQYLLEEEELYRDTKRTAERESLGGHSTPPPLPRAVNVFTNISPTKYMSPDQVISTYAKYRNAKDVGRLAVALAKHTYFGRNVLSQSTITGRGGRSALDAAKLNQLKGNIRSIFPQLPENEFDKVWEKCKESIANGCKRLRQEVE